MELASPGYHTIILDGILSEPEAERLARGTAGNTALWPATRL